MIYISNIEFSYCKRDVITDPQCTVWGLDQQNQQERWRENWGGGGGGRWNTWRGRGEREEKRVLRNWGLTLIVGLWGFCRTGQ